MKKTHILVTLAFDDDSPDTSNIGIELSIQQDIARLLKKYHHDKLISHYIVADNEIISEKLKSDDNVNWKEKKDETLYGKSRDRRFYWKSW